MSACKVDFDKIKVKVVTDYFERAEVETLPLLATPQFLRARLIHLSRSQEIQEFLSKDLLKHDRDLH